MADKYKNFEHLKSENTAEVDYHIEAKKRLSNVVIVTPHGGGIETGTSELVLFTANGVFSEYAFEGWRSSNNSELHITSTNFDEPIGLSMFNDHHYLLSYHGYSDNTNKHTKIGGRDIKAREYLLQVLTEAGFSAEILPEGDEISGQDVDNLCNKSKRGMGLQLEISSAQRNAFFGTNTRADRRNTVTAEFNNYVAAVKKVLNASAFLNQ